MATISYYNSLHEKISRQNYNNKGLIPIVELLGKTDTVLTVIPTIEANAGTNHEYLERTGLPVAYAIAAGQPVVPSSSTTAKQTAKTAIFRSVSKITKDDYQVAGNGSQLMDQEGSGHLQSIDQLLAQQTFYGSKTSETEFPGLAARYSTLTGTIAPNVISLGGVGSDNTSIYFIGLGGAEGASYISPKGVKNEGIDISSSSKGPDDWTDENDATTGGVSQVRYTHFSAYRGLVIPDWRNVVRICNIDKSDMMADTTGTSVGLINAMARCPQRVPPTAKVSGWAYFVNASVFEALSIQAMNKTNALLTYSEVTGKPIVTFQGYKIHRCDSILNTEARVI